MSAADKSMATVTELDDDLLARLLATAGAGFEPLGSRELCALRQTCRRLRDGRAVEIAAATIATRQMFPAEGARFGAAAAVRFPLSCQ